VNRKIVCESVNTYNEEDVYILRKICNPAVRTHSLLNPLKFLSVCLLLGTSSVYDDNSHSYTPWSTMTVAVYQIKLRTKAVFWIFLIFKIDRIIPFCNLFIEQPSYISRASDFLDLSGITKLKHTNFGNYSSP